MKEVKDIPELVGKFFCQDVTTVNLDNLPNGSCLGKVFVLKAVDVNAFCSVFFLACGGMAIVEYGRQSNGRDIWQFKTKFRDCDPVFMTSGPYCMVLGKEGFAEYLRVFPNSMLDKCWGVSDKDKGNLIEAIFQHSPVQSVTVTGVPTRSTIG